MRDDLDRLYRAFDVFCLSSDSEQQPVSLLEAMASGCATAATDVGDVRATLPEASGDLLVDPRGADPAAGLAAAIDGLLRDDARRTEEGRRARARVEAEYAFGTMLERYRTLYEEALG
jgi:glycosyltransferase involved in cell wall biosynthesis